MRDGFQRGDFGNGYRGNPNSATSFGAARRPPVMGGSSFGNGKGKNNGNVSSFGNGNSNGNSFGSGKRPAIARATTPRLDHVEMVTYRTTATASDAAKAALATQLLAPTPHCPQPALVADVMVA